MTDTELMEALGSMAPETGSLHCLGCGYEHNCSLHGCAICRETAGRIGQLVAENGMRNPTNDPLTLAALLGLLADEELDHPGPGANHDCVPVG